MPNKNYECSPTGRLTYRQLRDLINHFSEYQLDMDVTVEDPWEQECYPAELRICDNNHDSLEDFHPILYLI